MFFEGIDMPYPYPYFDESGARVSFTKSIQALATTRPEEPFCAALSAVSAFSLDDIKDRVVAPLRKGSLRSTDAFLKNSKGQYVFIEFKCETESALASWGRGKTSSGCGASRHETIQVVLRHKAIDSLYIAALTELRDVPMHKIQRNAVLIVVHKDDPHSDSLLHFAGNLRRLAKSSESPPKTAILWDLAVLKDVGMYSDVLTLTESQFAVIGPRYVK